MTKFPELHAKWMQNPEYKREYEKLDGEFALFEALLKARARAKMSQEDVARRLNTTQSAIARLEGGKVSPSIAMLRRYAHAVGAELKIQFVKKAV